MLLNEHFLFCSIQMSLILKSI